MKTSTHNTYRIRLPWGTTTIRANLAEASAPILIETEDGEVVPTPYQTADATHSIVQAARLVVARDVEADGWDGLENWLPDAPCDADGDIDRDAALILLVPSDGSTIGQVDC